MDMEILYFLNIEPYRRNQLWAGCSRLGLCPVKYITNQLCDLVKSCDLLDFRFLICQDQVVLGEAMEQIRQVKPEIKVTLWHLLSM